MRKHALETERSATSGTERYRIQYRQGNIGRHYHGRLHFAFTCTMSAVVIGYCLSQLRNVTALEWLTVPLTFIYANLTEYFGHRYVMHHKRRGFGLIYERHARQHHRFFTADSMEFDDARDLKAVLFPAVLVCFFFILFGGPLALVVGWVFGTNAAYLAAATAVAYFLNYELLHLAHHLPATHWISRLPAMRRLRWLHTVHHEPSLMASWNFNVSYPIGDWLFRTLWRGPRDSAPRR